LGESDLMEATSTRTGCGSGTIRASKSQLCIKQVLALGESDLMEATSRRTGCGGPSKVKLVRVGWIMSMEACTPSRSRVSL